jgi:hypothetical protein
MSNNNQSTTKMDNLLNIEKLSIVLKVSTLTAIVVAVWIVANKAAALDRIAESVARIDGRLAKLEDVYVQQAKEIAELRGAINNVHNKK